MLHLDYDLTRLHGAEYNPRRINERDLKMLAESVRTLGIVKPLIARGNVLVAGHQRSLALKMEGITRAPVYLLPCETTTYDEVRFNQFHNGTDHDSGDEECRISGLVGLRGFHTVEPEQIAGNLRSSMAYVRKGISELIVKYGSWGSCVATESGKVIHCAQYALACRLTKHPLTVFVIADKEQKKYQRYLKRQYGVFSYEHLAKTTYIQTFAQKMRLRSTAIRGNSHLYDHFILPSVRRHEHGIDFGSGQGDYPALLRKRGFTLHDVELYRRVGAGNELDRVATNKMITRLVEDLGAYGLYDYVVCDSVLNSVDSLDAQHAVLTTLKGLCKAGGTIFFSGRNAEYQRYLDNTTTAASTKSRLVFLDENGFTAQYRKGHWFYQKFHTKAEVYELCAKYGFRIVAKQFEPGAWYLKVINLPGLKWADLRAALEFEFELPLPGGETIGRSGDVIDAFGRIYSEYSD